MSVARYVGEEFSGSYNDLTDKPTLVTSVEDLDEWNVSLDCLEFADNKGLAFGDGDDCRIYSDGSMLTFSILNPSKQHASLDVDRFLIKYGGQIIVSGVASAPSIEYNDGHPVLEGYAVQKHVLYLMGTEGSGKEPQLVFADSTAPTSNVFFGYTQSTRALSLEGDGSGSFSFGISGDDIGLMGATPVAQQAAITDVPTAGSANAADNATAINLLISRIDTIGIIAA